jgi:iturin family lipopeptide synthetase B
LILDISGEINRELFKKAWNFVIEENEILRVVFRWEKVENPVQIILKMHRLQPKYYDFSSIDVNEKKKKLAEVKTGDQEEKFDLRDVPFRVTLCKIKKDKYEMIISNHHILYDGWSNGIILKEFFQAYDILCQGDNLISTSKTRGKFKEFTQWIQNQDIKRQEKFWQEYLKGFAAPKEISVKQRKTRKGIRPQVHFHSIPGDTRKKFENFVKRVKITLSALLYSSWGLLLQDYNNSDDILFGTAVPHQ